MAARRKLGSKGAKPRGQCPVCYYGFSPATDEEWTQRHEYHVKYSKRHQQYLKQRARHGK